VDKSADATGDDLWRPTPFHLRCRRWWAHRGPWRRSPTGIVSRSTRWTGWSGSSP